MMMEGKKDYVLVGDFLQQKWLHYALAYGGILLDGLIVPLLLFKPTRKYAFIVSIFFHVFNSFIFQIGIFPYLALAFSLFFFSYRKNSKAIFKKETHLYIRRDFYSEVKNTSNYRFFNLFYHSNRLTIKTPFY